MILNKELVNFKKDLDINKEYIVEMAGEIMRYPFLQDLIKKIFNVSISKTIIIDECTSVGAALYGFYLNNGNKLPTFPSFKKILAHNYHQVGCKLKYGNKSESFIFKDDLNEFTKINIKDIQLINRIELTYYYDKKTIKNFCKNPILCYYLIDLNKLKNDNPNLNQMSKLIIQHIYHNDIINIECLFIEEKNESGKINQIKQNCNYNNSISLIEGGLINNDNSKIKKYITDYIIKHSEKDQEYHNYSKERNVLSKLLYDLRDKNKDNNEKIKEIESYLKEISQLDNSNDSIKEKKRKLDELKKKIENKEIQKEEIEFAINKNIIIEEIKKSQEKKGLIKKKKLIFLNLLEKILLSCSKMMMKLKKLLKKKMKIYIIV